MFDEITLWSTMTMLLTLFILKASTRINTFEGEPYVFEIQHYGLAGGCSIVFTMLLMSSQNPIHISVMSVIIALLSVQLVIDVKYKELANEWNLLLFLISAPTMIYYFHDKLWAHALTCLILFLLFFAVWFVTDSLGFGDVKLIGAVGWLLTFGNIYPFLMISLLSGSLFGILDVIGTGSIKNKENWKQELAFGPHLILGFMLVQAFPSVFN